MIDDQPINVRAYVSYGAITAALAEARSEGTELEPSDLVTVSAIVWTAELADELGPSLDGWTLPDFLASVRRGDMDLARCLAPSVVRGQADLAALDRALDGVSRR